MLVSQTQKQVARSIKPSSHLLEATEDLTEFIDNQSDMYQALSALCNKLDTFVKLMDTEKAFNKSISVGMIKNFDFVDIQEFLIACQDIFIAKVREMKYSVKV